MTPRRVALLAMVMSVFAAGGCSAIVRNKLEDKDRATDGGARSDAGAPDTGVAGDASGDGGTSGDGGEPGNCEGQPDGTSCDAVGMRICRDERCVTSVCGDAYTDELLGEECDDGNMQSGDGCDTPTCTLTCSATRPCDDGDSCNGTTTCSPDALCLSSTPPLADGQPCEFTSGSTTAPGTCRGSRCVRAGCGDGVPDDDHEECDDGNLVPNDGCEPDCTVTCRVNQDCAVRDGNMCNGVEICDEGRCIGASSPLECNDRDDCTRDSCDPALGCMYDGSTNDRDRDGHYATACGGDDCNDEAATVYAGAPELCGDGLDNDCNGANDDTAPTFYVDCDRDGFAADTVGARTQCDVPPSEDTGCRGSWTTMRPSLGTRDCDDEDADVNPAQRLWFTRASSGPAAFDYDCDGMEVQRYTDIFGSVIILRCGPSTRGCTGPSGWMAERPPACGASAEYTSCEMLPGTGCANVTAARTQECH